MNLKMLPLLLGAACGLSACASVPTQYLTLTPVTPAARKVSFGTLQGKGLPLLIANVQMPADLDRLYLTREQSRNRFKVADHVRWIAPLSGMAQRVLAQDMADALPHKTVFMPGDPTPQGPYLLLRVVVQRFMPTDSEQVELNADWFVLNTSTQQIVAQGRSSFQAASRQHPRDQAAAMSQLLAELAQTVAAHLR